LKQHAPDDALDTLSKNVIVPLLEKMLSAGSIHEYEIDTQAVHTDAPGTFMIVYIASSPDGIDKVNAGIREAVKNDPLIGPAFGSLTDTSAHRDELARTNATYK
jgi:2-hydroxy-3-keto-5-methylthiopentenyl-1-phosphate phosphatase